MAKVEIEDTELAELRKQAAAAVKSTALAEALQGELKTAKEAAARVPGLEQEIAGFKTAQVESTFSGAGIADPKVRRVFQLEFDEQAATPTGEKDLGKWLANLQAAKPEERPAHLAPFIKAPTAGGQGAGAGGNGGGGQGGQGGRLPDTNAGARSPATAEPAITPEAIGQMDAKQLSAALGSLSLEHPELQALTPLAAPTAAATP